MADWNVLPPLHLKADLLSKNLRMLFINHYSLSRYKSGDYVTKFPNTY